MENDFVTIRQSKAYKTPRKRAPFTLQKGIFYNAKGRLLHGERAPLDLRVIKILTTHTTKGEY